MEIKNSTGLRDRENNKSYGRLPSEITLILAEIKKLF